MLECYLTSSKNSRLALEKYRRKYPGRRLPSHSHFFKIARRLRRFGTLDRSGSRIIHENEDMEIDVLALIESDPRLSVREVADNLNCSRSLVHKVLTKHKYKAFKVQPVQSLHPGDPQRRLNFCRWVLQRYEQDYNFLGNIIWTDESKFSNKHKFNRKNTHVWSQNQPHAVEQFDNQVRFSINVWCGVTKNRIYGPYFYDGILTGDRYLELLQNVIPEMLDNEPLSTRNRLIFQHDGAPPHRTQQVKNYLNTEFDTWIGNGGTIEWPARSPDLTPVDFSIWGLVKDKVYSSRMNNSNELKEKIRFEFQNISRETSENIQRNILKRIRLCIHKNGENFEQYL